MHYNWNEYGIYKCPGCEVLTVRKKTLHNKDGSHCSHCQLERKEVDPKTRKWVEKSYNHFKPSSLGAFNSALTKEHIINGQKYQMWGFDTKSKASANQQADQLRRHGKDVIVIESKNPDLIKGWIIFAKNRRGRRVGSFGDPFGGVNPEEKWKDIVDDINMYSKGKYISINVSDLSRIRDPTFAYLLHGVANKDNIINLNPNRFDAQVVVLNCPRRQALAIVDAIRLKFNKHQLRCYDGSKLI